MLIHFARNATFDSDVPTEKKIKKLNSHEPPLLREAFLKKM